MLPPLGHMVYKPLPSGQSVLRWFIVFNLHDPGIEICGIYLVVEKTKAQ